MIEPDYLIRKEAVLEMLGKISPATLSRRIKAGLVPKPKRFGKSQPFWRYNDIKRLIEQD